MTLDKLRYHNKAIKCFNEAIKINPSYCRAWCNKGITLDKLEQFDEDEEVVS